MGATGLHTAPGNYGILANMYARKSLYRGTSVSDNILVNALLTQACYSMSMQGLCLPASGCTGVPCRQCHSFHLGSSGYTDTSTAFSLTARQMHSPEQNTKITVYNRPSFHRELRF